MNEPGDPVNEKNKEKRSELWRTWSSRAMVGEEVHQKLNLEVPLKLVKVPLAAYLRKLLVRFEIETKLRKKKSSEVVRNKKLFC